jgi:MoaA/NifB/PqqE/SkfB family radical SAM enzyme
VTEAAALGGKYLLAGGSEPFLRTDLPELMGDVIASGMIPFVTTKYPITVPLAKRLANAGVAHISLSVDSMRPDVTRVLIGSSSYPAQVQRSVDNLKGFGIEVSIQTVATNLNYSDIEEVAAFASKSGAQMMQVVPFEPVRMQSGLLDEISPLMPDIEKLRQIVERCAVQNPRTRVELFDNHNSNANFYCDVGRTKMCFLPDGVVHRCYKLTNDLSLIGKDLRRVSVAAAWHDVDFNANFFPAKQQFHVCDQCAQFNKCHERGRCIYKAFVNHHMYCAPDRSCGGPFHAQDLKLRADISGQINLDGVLLQNIAGRH